MGFERWLMAMADGDGIKMWLLSQGPWVKVVAPEEFVGEVKYRIKKMLDQYDPN